MSRDLTMYKRLLCNGGHTWQLLVEHYDWCQTCGATRVHPQEEEDVD